jgi:hypothetical protein
MGTNCCLQSLKGREHSENVDVDTKMSLKGIGGEGVINLAQEVSVVGCCEHGNEPSGFTENRDFVD